MIKLLPLLLLLLPTETQAALPAFDNAEQQIAVCRWLDGVVDSYRAALLTPNKFEPYEKMTLFTFLIHRKAVCGTGSEQEINNLENYLNQNYQMTPK